MAKTQNKKPANRDFKLGLETPGVLLLGLGGQWRLKDGLMGTAEVEKQLKSTPEIKRISFETKALADWDSSLLVMICKLSALCKKKDIEFDINGLPKGVRHLLDMRRKKVRTNGHEEYVYSSVFFTKIGEIFFHCLRTLEHSLSFIGEATWGIARWVRGRGCTRWSDLWLAIQEAGAEALPIVVIISLLVGIILAFVGAVQLRPFGAEIYIANLTGLAMTREMGAMMTAIIMAGRTGAAYASELGTMQVNEEIDAYKTLGVSPMEFLVVPRMLGLALMMPLLCLFADLFGIIGGAIIGIGLFDINTTNYFLQTQSAISLTDISIGVVKSIVFGLLVATAGCMRGMQCGRSSEDVGRAATSAVVTGIVFIIIADALFTFILDTLGI